MRWLPTIVLLLCPLVGPSTSAPAPGPTQPRLELRLRALTPKVKVGQAVRWEVVIANRGKRAVTLVQPGDGSDCGWRTPVVEWLRNGKVDGVLEGAGQADVKVEKGARVGPAAKPELLPACLSGRGRRGGRCGNINALKASEVLDLEPGKEAMLNPWVGGHYWPRGKHQVALRYFNLPDLKWRGLPLGKHDDKAMARIRNSPRLTLTSNTVEIVVEE